MSFSGNVWRNNKMPARQTGGGPLMTDHLHDLELELELLKRKRQLIQHQQSEMLYNQAPANDNVRYNRPSQSNNDRFNEPTPLSFSHLYNEGPRDDRSFGLKRRSQPEWSSGPSDRYDAPTGNKRSRPPPFEHYEQNNTFQRAMPNPQPLLGVPKPLMNYQGRRGQPNKQNQGPKPFNQPFHPGPKPFNQGSRSLNRGPKPLTQHPNFNRKQAGSGPNRPKPGPGPNRPNPGPGPNRPNPGLGPNRPKPGPGPNRPNPGLGPNRPKPGPAANSQPNFNPNKPVTPKKSGPFNTSPRAKKNVLQADEQPSNKTNGRLELALGMIVKEIRATYGNSAEYGGLFGSIPMNRVMKQGIRDRLRAVMTGKVVGIVPDIVAEYRKAYPLETDKEIVELAVVEKLNNEHTHALAIKLFEEGEPEQYFKKNMGRILDNRLTDMLNKVETMIYEENKELTNALILGHLPELKDAGNTASEKTVKVDEKPAATEETSDQTNGDKPAKETTAAPEVKTAEPDATPVQKTDVKPIVTNPKENAYDKWMAMLLSRKLPHLLYKNKEKILKLFERDHMFQNTKAAVLLNTYKKAQGANSRVNRPPRQSTGGQESTNGELPRGSWLFVKVQANPSMPKRKHMQEFLNQFQPKTIKRHKKNFNLLFVGLDSQENYDKMLAANQTIVGNATITTSPSNVTKPNEDQNTSGTDIDKILTPQLDDQINDLLSSIRKSDEPNGGENIDLTTADTNDVTATESNVPEPEGNGSTQENVAAEQNVTEVKDDEVQVVEDGNADKDVVTIEDDEVAPLKSDEVQQAAKAPGTPAKGKAPATPSSIRTRRSSRLLN